MNERQFDLLRELTESFGPSGFEAEATSVVRGGIEDVADAVRVNRLGSLLFEKRGSSDRPLVLVPGHVDEIGFCITGIHDKTGFLTFTQLGSWFDQVLLGQRVLVRTRKGDLTGVISATPPHLLPPDERKKVVAKEKMFIDIGTSSKQESEDLGVRIGDAAVPVSPFSLIRDGKVAMGKAFDDRIGVFISMEVLRRLKEDGIEHPNTYLGAATTQEEVGARGAMTVANEARPDVCLVVEVDVSGDVPGTGDKIAPARMGKGVSILTYDASMIPNQPLKEFVIRVAEERGIPHQLSLIPHGRTDGGQVHISGSGCPSLVLAVPTRHIHSHVGLLALSDVEAAINLMVACIERLDAAAVSSFVA